MQRVSAMLAALCIWACSGEPERGAPASTGHPKASETTAHHPSTIADRIGALPAPYDRGDYENGRRLFSQCSACHTVSPGGKGGVGPGLHGVIGRTAGQAAGYPGFTPELRASAIVWDPATLDAWIANPRDLVPQSSMIFPGIRAPEDRRDLIAYLAVATAD
ncbi:MAG: c-type cytochrome [Hyphomonadaceae bacterium]|nr:c-type cytochrome [Hyphomonadaceae bacterium]